jgi:hypothetical protein
MNIQNMVMNTVLVKNVDIIRDVMIVVSQISLSIVNILASTKWEVKRCFKDIEECMLMEK